MQGGHIRKQYDDEEGTWHVQVFTQGEWVKVAAWCDEDEAEDCINDLCRWKRGE